MGIFEFWFRKEYEKLIYDKKLVKFVRPGIRLFPAPKGTNINDKVNVRILNVPSTSVEQAILNPYIAEAIVKEIKIKKIGEMDSSDFEGTSGDSSSQDKILTHLEKIYNKIFTKEDTVTVFKIDYI